MEAKEKLTQLKARVSALQASKDRINREQGIEERKLEEAYGKLRELGVENPEQMSAKALQALADEAQTNLTQILATLEEQVTQGEALLQKYEQLQS